MKPPSLTPIPSPPRHYWRQFRVNALPHLTFLVVLVAVVLLWRQNLSTPLLTGQVEGLEAVVTCPQSGRIAQLNVSLYQEVKEGDVLAVVEIAEPTILSNTLNLVRAEMQAIRTDGGFRPTDKVRYASLEFDWLNLRAELASLQAEYTLAKAELDRTTVLFNDKYVSQSEYDQARTTFEVTGQTLKQKQEVVDEMEKQLKALNPANSQDSQYIAAALAVAEEQFRVAEAELAPIVLTAPISGRVRSIDKLAGMAVATREPILTISDTNASHIIGFIQQPLTRAANVGDSVLVRKRGTRKSGTAKVTAIGPRVELFNSPLRVRGMDSAQQRGQPLIISLPTELTFVPGEVVDLSLQKNRDLPSGPDTGI